MERRKTREVRRALRRFELLAREASQTLGVAQSIQARMNECLGQLAALHGVTERQGTAHRAVPVRLGLRTGALSDADPPRLRMLHRYVRGRHEEHARASSELQAIGPEFGWDAIPAIEETTEMVSFTQAVEAARRALADAVHHAQAVALASWTAAIDVALRLQSSPSEHSPRPAPLGSRPTTVRAPRHRAERDVGSSLPRSA